MSGIVHVWASPDPDEYEAGIDTDAMVCTEAEPFAEQPGIAVVFHPWSTITGRPACDYVCRWCGTSTGRASLNEPT